MVDQEVDTGIHGIYAYGEVIGEGGMGEVVLAHDRRIGRDVAVKRLKTKSFTEEDHARFLREARIQARLDHRATPNSWGTASVAVPRRHSSKRSALSGGSGPTYTVRAP